MKRIKEMVFLFKFLFPKKINFPNERHTPFLKEFKGKDNAYNWIEEKEISRRDRKFDNGKENSQESSEEYNEEESREEPKIQKKPLNGLPGLSLNIGSLGNTNGGNKPCVNASKDFESMEPSESESGREQSERNSKKPNLRIDLCTAKNDFLTT